MGKLLVFGGPRLHDPQYTWFYSAIHRGMLHGHPGDVAFIVSKDEAKELESEVYGSLGRNVDAWTKDEWQTFTKYAGKKLILADQATGYVDRLQAEIVDINQDVRSFLGLPAKDIGEKEDGNGHQ